MGGVSCATEGRDSPAGSASAAPSGAIEHIGVRGCAMGGGLGVRVSAMGGGASGMCSGIGRGKCLRREISFQKLNEVDVG